MRYTISTFALICLSLWFSLWNWSDNNPFPYRHDDVESLNCSGDTNLWDCVSVKEKDNTIIVRLLEVFGLDYSTEKERDLKFIDYAKAVLNMALWLMSFIALIMTIYTFYMIIFSDNEAWIKKAKWNLVGFFIALGVVWLAWLIVSFIFWRYESNWKEKEDDISERNITMIAPKLSDQIYLTI